MKRVALISDQHFDTSSRWEETLRIAHWIAEDLAKRDVDAIALGGDLFERRPNPQETKAVAEWVIELANIAPVVGVYGNHDVPDSLAELPLLEANYPIAIFDRPGVHIAGGVAFACLPWPRKAHLLAQLGLVPQEHGAQAALAAMQNVFRGLGQQLAEHAKAPRLFLGHVMVRGSRVSTGQPIVGADLEIGLDDLGLVKAQAYLLGHIHMGQEFDVGGAPAIYPGSPRRTAFGEVEPKGYLYATLERDRGLVDWFRVETPAARMFLIEDEWGAEQLGTFGWLVGLHGEPATDDLYKGAEVRFRYYVQADQREAARASANALLEYFTKRGVVNVKVDEVVRTTTRARAPEIAEARSTGDKLRALWRARNDYPPPDREGRLLSKLEQIEGEVRNAS